MLIIENMAPELARQLAEAERMVIRAWDLQRHGKADPHSEPVSDTQAESSATLLERLAGQMLPDEREDIVRLVQIVRTRLDLKAN